MKALLCLISLSLICCTDMGSTDTYNYTIRNESGVNIKIIGYLMYTKDTYIINLENMKERTQIYKDGLPPRGYDWKSFYGSSNGMGYSVDSIKVIYNNTKYKDFNFRNIDDKRNPISNQTGNLIETYTYTRDDYEKAKDCNGNCE